MTKPNRIHQYLTGSFMILLLCLFSATAWGDVPPPEDYMETCTLEIQSENGAECVECEANFESNPCAEMHEAEGYSKSCQTWGASVWTEIWCKAGAETAGSNAPAGGAETPEAGSEQEAGGEQEVGGEQEAEDAAAKDTEDEGCSQHHQSPITLLIGFMMLSMLLLRARSSKER